MLYLKVKKKLLQTYTIKIQTLMIYLPYDSAHPELCKKNVPYNLAKIIFLELTLRKSN